MKAALTADVILSREIKPALLEERMQLLAKEIEQRCFKRKKTFEFYRGDSFQAVLEPAVSLSTALAWKAAVKSTETKGRQWDIRIAIGIGEITHLGKKLSTSAGKAFEYSGLLLDDIKKQNLPGISIRSFSETWNEQLDVECMLADTIIQRWTVAGAESVYHQLLNDETQERLAERLGIAQSSVYKRLSAANWNAIRKWEQYFRKQCLSFIKTK